MFFISRLRFTTNKLISVVLLSMCAVAGMEVQASDNDGSWSQDVRRGAKFWIGETGPTGPIFTGPHQFPFICTTVENGLGQPLVDNQFGIGNAVFPEVGGIPDITADPVGYSRLCSIATRVDFFY